MTTFPNSSMTVVGFRPETPPNPSCCNDTGHLCTNCAGLALQQHELVVNQQDDDQDDADDVESDFATSRPTLTNNERQQGLGVPTMNFEVDADDQDDDAESEIVGNAASDGGLGLPVMNFEAPTPKRRNRHVENNDHCGCPDRGIGLPAPPF